jgi:predicted nucleic acid-binding protein
MSSTIEPVFVDTNVLVYARDTQNVEKHRQAGEWMRFLWQTRRGRLSAQVLNEYFVTVTRELSQSLTDVEARDEVRELMAWAPEPVDHDLIERAWVAASSWPLSHWDALIVAAAQRAGCTYLLTEDLQTGQRFGELQILSPFSSSPPALF